ncbi:HD domain-containing protein [Acuticoccus kandeliae]|uniref:HD domain-containing protein n=1 Tax=Acuticoccus kandeliae TaxID=2073160 RepID=UPI000D3EE1B4|nr:HD domain-containing protein [Acuticoccus kandeliae]
MTQPDPAQSLAKDLAFLVEIDRLKSIVRASPLLDRSRKENSAEHSWHVAMYALILADKAEGDIDIGRVISMLLIHDIVEIDAGDMPLHGGGDKAAQEKAEAAAADRLFSLLSPEKAEAFLALWHEFEAGETPDARFARCVDRLQPVLGNLETGGGTWTEMSVTHDRVVERCGPPIERGSPALWAHAAARVKAYFDEN